MAVGGNLYNLETDPASQTAIGGVGTEGTNLVSLADNTFREIAAELANYLRDIGGANTYGFAADAYTITSASGQNVSALWDGMLVATIPTDANTTTTPTLNFGSTSAKVIKKVNDSGAETALAIGDIIVNRFALFRYHTAWASGAGAWEYMPLGFSEIYTSTEKTKLSGIETAATADQTGAEIKTLYEAEADTNAFTDAEQTKLANIEASADVTDATNVDAAGAVMNSDTSTAAMNFVVDEDNMVSDSATKVPTQQSVKAYVDSSVGGSGALLAANNLSDVNSATTSRTNLGVGTGDSPQFTALNIGHATDTTLARSGAGELEVEGNRIFRVGGADVPIADGGTGASTAAAARTNLGFADATVSFDGTSITSGVGQFIKRTIHTSSGTHTFDADTVFARIMVQGGGGGGGGAISSGTDRASAGRSGGGGGYAEKIIDVTGLSGAATITVGAAGSAGAATPTNGGDGGDSTYQDTGVSGSDTITGNGGDGGTAGGSAGGVQSISPEPGGSSSGGTINIDGDPSDWGLTSAEQAANSWATNTSYALSGKGGGSRFGNGGRGVNVQSTGVTGAPGVAATGYGAGGSGGVSTSTNGGEAGAAGTAGIIIIEEFA